MAAAAETERDGDAVMRDSWEPLDAALPQNNAQTSVEEEEDAFAEDGDDSQNGDENGDSKADEEAWLPKEPAQSFRAPPATIEREEDLEFLGFMSRALEQKDAGNSHFRASRVEKALETYAVGLAMLKECSAKTGVGGDTLASVSDEIAAKVEFDEVFASLTLNRAACLLRLQKYEHVVAETSEVLRLQPENVKALYRRGVAKLKLNLYDAASEDLQKAVDLEPTNRDAARELARLKERLHAKRSSDKKKMGKAVLKKGLYGDVEEERLKKKKLAEQEDERKRRAHARDNEERTNQGLDPRSFDAWSKAEDEKKKAEEKKRTERSRELERRREEQRRKERAQDVETIDDLDLKDCKGYKVLADGRKTSYFTREVDQLDDKTKEALSKAPPRLVSEEGPPLLKKSASSGSAWNAAGTTFEERPQTKWVDDRLKAHLAGVRVAGFAVTDVKKLAGEASILISRGKPRYVFDYSATLDWEFSDLEENTYKGSLTLPELSSTVNDAKYEQALKHKGASCPQLDASLPQFHAAVDAAISAFVNEYHQRVLR